MRQSQRARRIPSPAQPAWEPQRRLDLVVPQRAVETVRAKEVRVARLDPLHAHRDLPTISMTDDPGEQLAPGLTRQLVAILWIFGEVVVINRQALEHVVPLVVALPCPVDVSPAQPVDPAVTDMYVGDRRRGGRPRPSPRAL